MSVPAIAAGLGRIDPQEWLPAPRRGQDLMPVGVMEAAALDDSHAIAIAALADGRRFFVPVTRDVKWRRARLGDGLLAPLLHVSEPLEIAVLRSPPLDAGDERALSVDMSNDIVIIDDEVALKWQFIVSEGSLIGPTVVTHLDAVGFAEMPQPYAFVVWDGHLVASVMRYLPEASDGWTWMVDDVRAFAEGVAPEPDWAAALGALVGRLHAAAITPSDYIEQPVRVGDLSGFVQHYRALLDRDTSAHELHGELARWRDRFEDALATMSATTELIPIHGDLHAGQLLRWREGIAVSDFDGNPLIADRGALGPSAYDVACLLRSLDHVAAVVRNRIDGELHERTQGWATRARSAALAAYREVPGVPALDEALLRAFEALSPLHEAMYAHDYLPRWAYVPRDVMQRDWLAQ